MRRLIDMDTIQIEITNACVLQCGNCTRFCGHHKKPYMMDYDYFKRAIDSMHGFPKMVGIMGGEPLLHPEFEKFCDYAASRIPRERLGLWTILPQKFVRYRDVIVRTFGNIFINDHTRSDIYHAPILVSATSVFEKLYPTDPVEAKRQMWLALDACWLQNSWSASINPKGAFFCEVAAAMAVLFDGPDGWPVEPGWWKRAPKDYVPQMEQWCPGCGVALPLPRRSSQSEVDDVSPDNLERLQECGSRKVKQELFQISDSACVKDPEPMAAYKDTQWRNMVAARFGMFLTINENHFWDPHLKPGWSPDQAEKPSLFAQMLAG